MPTCRLTRMEICLFSMCNIIEETQQNNQQPKWKINIKRATNTNCRVSFNMWCKSFTAL